jgi:hypothetical protein
LSQRKSERGIFDRDIFVFVILIGLALSLNTLGLLRFVQEHTGGPSLRVVGYAAACTGGGWIGLFSRRIASSITAWRDRQ